MRPLLLPAPGRRPARCGRCRHGKRADIERDAAAADQNHAIIRCEQHVGRRASPLPTPRQRPARRTSLLPKPRQSPARRASPLPTPRQRPARRASSLPTPRRHVERRRCRRRAGVERRRCRRRQRPARRTLPLPDAASSAGAPLPREPCRCPAQGRRCRGKQRRGPCKACATATGAHANTQRRVSPVLARLTPWMPASMLSATMSIVACATAAA